MSLRTVTCAVVALCAMFVSGCKDVESDHQAPRSEATEPTAPSVDATEPGGEPDTEPNTEVD